MLIARYWNVSVVPLAASGVFTSPTLYTVEGSPLNIPAGGQTSFPAEVYSSNFATGNTAKYFNAIAMADQASAANGFVVQMSPDQGTTWRTVASATLAANVLSTLSVLIAFPGAMFRVQLTNSATLQTYLILGASTSEV